MADISSITLPGGGTYDLKDKNAVPKYGMGKNLLRNWYFVGGGTGRGVFPVNQRRISSATQSSFIFIMDGWAAGYGSGGVDYSLASGYFEIGPHNSSSYATLQQVLDNNMTGKTLTASILLSDGTLLYGTETITGENDYLYNTYYSGYNIKLWVAAGNVFLVSRSSANIQIVAVKLELGTEQTLAHQENGVWVLNEIPDYEYELYRCITSTADPSDTYANKSLATEQQLAYVETGSTASRAYAVGKYFCLNGLLYLVTAAISSGGTFIPGTNCKQVTDGGINAIAPEQLLNERITGAGNYSVPSLRSYNLFIVQVLGNSLNFRTLVIPPGVSTQINVDATASIYARVTMIIELTNNRVSVTSFNSASWNQAMLRVWGVSLPV